MFTCVLVSLCTFFLSACSAPSTRPTLKIGLVAPFEGRYREIGEEIIYAVRLAVREANADGGVGGYTVELMAYDDMGNATLAAEQAHKLTTDPQVLGVLGHWLDDTTLTAAPIYAQAGIPFIATTASAELDPAAFRLWPNEAAYLAALPDAPHCPLPCNTLEDLTWLQSAGGSVDTPALGPALWGLNQFPTLTNDRANNTALIAPAPLPTDSSDPTFAGRYLTLSPGPQPRYFAVLAYDATQLLLNAIARDIAAHGLPTRSGIETALAQSSYDGLSGKIIFNSDRDWDGVTGWVYRWRDGVLVEFNSQ